MQAISLVITCFQRTNEVLRSFDTVYEDVRINEIIIYDDESSTEVQKWLIDRFIGKNKTVLQIGDHVGMASNKARAISVAKNEWCMLLDSDNVLTKQYIDSIYALKNWSPDTIYNPSFARPHFDFRHFAGKTFRKGDIRRYAKMRNFDSLINVCNYFVNRDQYLANFVYDDSIKGTDTSFFLYNWLKNGNKFHIVRGMEYEHTVHDGSEFLKNLEYNMHKGEEIKKMILAL